MPARLRLQIDRQEPFADGMEFGDTGAYERLSGTVHFEIDPDAPENESIVDLEHAKRNADGLVEYSTDFYILRPVDLARGNRRLIYDVNNRGNMRLLQFMNDAVHSNAPADAEHAGNGFLMRRGYSIVWSGWQEDLLPGEGRLTMDLPVAMQGGEPITGLSRTEFVADEPGVTSIPLSANDYTRSYETASLDTSEAAFTMREYERDDRVEVPADEWSFARLDENGQAVASNTDLHYPDGFQPGWIYGLVYTAQHPRVMGLGFTGLRDLISFLLHDQTDDAGTTNPLRDGDQGIDVAYAWGRSQSGRFLRDFVYRGFNEDGDGRQVFAGISPHVSGAGRVWLNSRFAQPGRFPRQHNDHLYPSDQFPFAYAETTDTLTGSTDAILKRPDTDPFVIHTQTSSEYWDRRGSLVHTDTEGNDLPDHERARVYLFASSQHNADPLLGSAEAYRERMLSGIIEPGSTTAHPTNPLNTAPLLRALLDALDAWASEGTEPPPSMTPLRSDATLVTAAEAGAGFPTIPDVSHPDEPSRLHVQDFGPEFGQGIVTREPPVVDRDREYAVLVPGIDGDGNERAGIRAPHVSAPLATYTGWNYRPEGQSARALKGTVGSYFPFPSTTAERAESGDTRLSIQERYLSSADYALRVETEAGRLVDARLLLDEDAGRYIEAAKAFDRDWEPV
ncbi:alpha/beta hydrolase domain-containing protein [soil metagenome]